MNTNSLTTESANTATSGVTGKKGQQTSKGMFAALLKALQHGAMKGAQKTVPSQQAGTVAKTDISTKQEETSITNKLAGAKEKKVSLKQAEISGVLTHKVQSHEEVHLKATSKKNTSLDDALATVIEPSGTAQVKSLKAAEGSAEQIDIVVLQKNKHLLNQTQQGSQKNSSSTVMNNIELSPNEQAETILSQHKKVITPPNMSKEPVRSDISSETSQQNNIRKDNIGQSSQTMNLANNIKQEETITFNDNRKAGVIKTSLFEPKENDSHHVNLKQVSVSGAQKQNSELAIGKSSEQASKSLLSFHEETVSRVQQPQATKEPPLSVTADKNQDVQDKVNTKVSPAVTNVKISGGSMHHAAHISHSGAVAAQVISSESGGNAAQQEFSSGQQNIDLSLTDTNKAEAKAAKNADFQSQLAYKSQRSFSPGEAMLEVIRSAHTGKTSLELQLEPAHLGKVQVSIQMDSAKQIQIAFTVDQAASRQVLEQQMPQLRLAMAQQGLDLGSFSMQMNQQGQQQNQSGSTHQTGTQIATNDSGTPHQPQTQETHRSGINTAAPGHLNIRV